MNLPASDRTALVETANLAPSVHNTQPTRWRFAKDAIEFWIDLSRCLSVGDPALNDAGLSCGAALEGTVIALADLGIGAQAVEDLWHTGMTNKAGQRLAARLVPGGSATPDPVSAFVRQRFTWRGKFAPIPSGAISEMTGWATGVDCCTMVLAAEEKQWLADLNDRLSLKVFRNKPYRDELRSWMRLSARHPDWTRDGLNARAMQMSAVEAAGARVALASPAFEILSAAGLGGAMVSERTKTMSATGIAFFHMPEGASPIEAGRRFYRLWLDLTRHGVVAWPMAVLADDPEGNAACKARYGIPDDRRLINVLRFGGFDRADLRPGTARLPAAELILA